MATLTEQVARKFSRWANDQHRRHLSAFDFGGHHQHGGPIWAPRKEFAPTPLLFKTGKLKSSVSIMLSKLKVNFMVDSKIAFFHQYGTRYLPARPVIYLSDQDVDKAVAAIKSLDGTVVTAEGV